MTVALESPVAAADASAAADPLFAAAGAAVSADDACAAAGERPWRVMLMLATVAMVATVPGQTFGFAFFIPEFRSALGLTSSEVSAYFLWATLAAALPVACLGGVADRLGLRRSLLLALAGLSASCLFMATVRSGPALLLGFFLLRSIGPGILSMLATNTLAAWFDRYLGTASSIMQVSMAATIALGPAALFALIQALGWRETYVLLSGVVGLGVLPLFWHYYRDRPPVRLGSASASQAEARWGDAGGFTLREALRTRVFWVLLAAIGVWSLIGTALMFHVEVIFAERNADLQQSAWASTAMAGAMAALQLGGGFLADRFSVRAVLSAGMLLIGVGCAAAAAAATGWQLLACYVIYGAGQGLMSIAAATGWPRFFGRSHLGAIRGAVTAVAFALSSLGPLAVGLSADYLQGTSHSLWAFAGSALLLAALGAALLPARNAA